MKTVNIKDLCPSYTERQVQCSQYCQHIPTIYQVMTAKEPLNNLKISSIFGSSSGSRTCFSASKDLVAYAASGGVVVARLDLDTQQVISQRFFCASSKPQRQDSFAAGNISKDQYGLLKPEHSIVIKGDTWNDSDENSEKTVTIGSDLSPARCSPSKIKDRIKDISCLCLSADAKFLIVGETGHQPRILLYSMAPNANDFPVFVVHQHSYGIAQLQFHPEDSTIFTSLGLINDGFLHIWKLSTNGVRLVASNKNSTIVLGLNWYKDSAIVTYGVRQIKVWKFDNPNNHTNSGKLTIPRTRTAIKGKNIVLGSLIESTFIDCAWLRDDQLLFLTDTRQLILYQNGSLISQFDLDSDRQYDNILVDWDDDKLWFSFDEFVDNIPLTVILNNQEKLRPCSTGSTSRNGSPIKNSLLEQKFPEGDSNGHDKHKILMMKLLINHTVLFCTSKGEISLIDDTVKQVSSPSLNDIKVFKKIDENTAILSSRKGDIKLFDGRSLQKFDVEIKDFSLGEELSSIAFSEADKYLAIGYSTGRLSIFRGNHCEFDGSVHNAAINDIQMYESHGYRVAITVSRDRTMNFIQHVGEEWNVCQTIKDNKGNVLQAELFENNLFTISSDRTVSCYRLDIVNKELNVSKETIFSVKNSPLRIQITRDDIIVSRADKTIQIFDRSNNYNPRVLRLVDEQGDGILVSHFYVNADNDQIICSSTLDKTIRCFSYTTGKCLSQYHAHSEPVIGMTIVAGKFVTVTGNGCLFSWEMKSNENIEDSIPRSLDLPSGLTDISTASSPITPIRSSKILSPTKLQHPTPCTSPTRNERSVTSTSKRGIIPSSQLKTNKNESSNILAAMKHLRMSLLNGEEIENIDKIKEEVLLLHTLLVPHEDILQRFGDELMQLIGSKISQ